MKVGSLFAGIGGFDLGLERAGIKPLWQVEKDKACRSVLARHWPDVPHYEDVLTLPLSEMERPDVICGGSPCQAFSVAGKRLSLDDARGNLTLAFAAVVDHFNPEVVIWENVPGVLSTNDNAFGSFLAALVGSDNALPPFRDDGKWPRSGMVAGPKRVVGWRILDAQYFGVAQRRRRECCRLQGFPDDWNDGQADRARYRQLGNAIAVPVAEWLGHRIAKAVAE